MSAASGIYVPAKTYEGHRPGYVFTTRDGRTGYYDDPVSRDRAREAGDPPPAKRARGGGGGELPAAVESILAKADEEEIAELDAASLKKLLLAFEKKITRNQQLRVKYFDEPARFAESEVDLDDAIRDMGLCAAAPELYPLLAELGGVASIVALVAHENSDISASACSLLYDLTDADVVDSSPDAAEAALVLVGALEAASGLEHLASNIERFNEAQTEEAEAVHNTLGVFENAAEIGGPATAEKICAATSLFRWLAERVKAKSFDANKLYASELVAILAGGSEKSAEAVARTAVGEADAIDALLQACAYYRRRGPKDGDEEECVENLFQAVASILAGAPASALPAFVKAEGVELMLRCVREGKHAAACALRVLAAALAPARPRDAEDPARRFFEAGGLKVIFPALAGRGAAKGAIVGDATKRSRKKKRKRRLRDEQRDLDEHVVSIVASLCLYAAPDAPDLAHKRLVHKFLENGGEKIRKLAERYATYAGDVRAAERVEDAAGGGSGDDDEGARLARTARVLRAGLHALRLATCALAFCAVYSPAARETLEGLLGEARGEAQISPHELANVLADYARDYDDGEAAADADARRRAETLRGWAGALSALGGPAN